MQRIRKDKTVVHLIKRKIFRTQLYTLSNYSLSIIH